MDRHGQHVGALVEDALRAVAVMQVDVDDRHARGEAAKVLGGDRRIVEEAEAAGDIAEGMMARRAAERIGGAFACQHRVGGRHRRSRRSSRRCPSVSAEIGQEVSAM